MKKLVFMLAAVAMAAGVQAASLEWSISTAGTTAFEASPSTLANTTVYLFWDYSSSANAKAGMADLLTSLRGGGTVSGNKDSASLNASGLMNTASGSKETTVTADVKYYGFAAVLADDGAGNEYVYFSAVKNAKATDIGAAAANFDLSGANVYDMDTSAFAAAGWYQIASSGGSSGGDVPEPTSGLLLVLGGAMLALRRRRA